MRLYAFAALLALSIVGLAAGAAQAGQPCCGEGRYPHHGFVTRPYHVIETATVFGCDGYHCQTNIILASGIDVKARCRNGWCELRGIPMKNVWVLERCLRKIGYGHAGHPGRGGFEEEDEFEEEHDFEDEGEDERFRF